MYFPFLLLLTVVEQALPVVQHPPQGRGIRHDGQSPLPKALLLVGAEKKPRICDQMI